MHNLKCRNYLITCVVLAYSIFPLKKNYAKELRVGISLPTQQDIGWVRYKEAFEAEAKKIGVTLLVQIANQDASLQASQVENLLLQNIDVLILAPQDAKAASSLVLKAHKSRVRVVSLDRLILDSKVDFYVSFDNEKVGELQGEYLTKRVPQGNYVVLSGAPTDNNAKLFKSGAMKYIEPLVKSGAVRIVMEQSIRDWQPSFAQKLVENALTANKNKIHAVLAPNDNTAGGIIQALSAQKLAGKISVTGQDAEASAIKRIIAGTQAMTVFKDQGKLARLALNVATKVAKKIKVNPSHHIANGKINVPSLLLKPVAVDKNNIKKELLDSGYLKMSDINSNES